MKASVNSIDEEDSFIKLVGTSSYAALNTMLRSFIIYCMINEEPLRCSRQGEIVIN